MCSLSNSIIINITRVESTRTFKRRAHRGRVLNKTRNRLLVPESQRTNLALVHKTQRSTSHLFQELLSTSKGIVFLTYNGLIIRPLLVMTTCVTSSVDCTLLSACVPWLSTGTDCTWFRGSSVVSDRLIYVVIHHCVLCSRCLRFLRNTSLVKQHCTSDRLVVSTHAFPVFTISVIFTVSAGLLHFLLLKPSPQL